MNDYKRIILVGAAGSGKTWLGEQMIENGYKFPLTYTTRPQRDNEEDGVHYNFVSLEKFKEMVESDKMYEYVDFNNWFYGRTKEDFHNGNLVIMTPAGILQMPEKDLDESFIVYLDIDEDIRRERIAERIDADDTERRIQSDNIDFEDFETFNYRITDKDFTYAQVQMAIDRFTKINWNTVPEIKSGLVN